MMRKSGRPDLPGRRSILRRTSSASKERLLRFARNDNRARLGRGLINAQPRPYRCELDDDEVVGRELVVARRDPPTLLDLIQAPLNQATRTMEMRAKADRNGSWHGRNHHDFNEHPRSPKLGREASPRWRVRRIDPLVPNRIVIFEQTHVGDPDLGAQQVRFVGACEVEKFIDASQHLSSLGFDIADNRVGVMPAK